ncbi:MAG: hypothetical protein CBC24_09235 [Candidatus Pelagibacter sp. TMED64]|nr:MAG: hypothetical protein CBC24_09235 [Candidatus Pelagibacter sp. TMED64]|tara:strand:+ start:798 stop:1124 length:327 start_codon:yes stop_codon:yes gene_type:complete
MAQDFRQVKMKEIGTSETDIPDGSNFDSYDCIIGMNLANITTSTISVDAYIKNGGNTFYIIKSMPLVSGSAYSYDGKINVVSGDRLYFKSDTASSLDVIVSFVDAISS